MGSHLLKQRFGEEIRVDVFPAASEHSNRGDDRSGVAWVRP
jgi:hypothetical protein